jgi:hypothetical protein
VNFARISTPTELRETVKGMCDAFDGDKGANADKKEHALNRVTLSQTTGGRGILNGSLDTELTDIVLTALDAEMEQLREKGETRKTPELRSAALDSICQQYLASRGGILSKNTLERISCDCRISRIITDGPGTVLDVGRMTRAIPAPLWNALVGRDRHCTAPSCDRPPGMCEAHHIWHWANGGPTNLENLKLLCWFHHKQQHIHDAQQHK